MTTIEYAILSLCVFLAVLAVAKCLIDINELDKRIDEIIAEEKRQNKRIDILEKREQMRQLEQRKDQTYIEPKDLFKEW
jgi:low affinity Fe/Cu permease